MKNQILEKINKLPSMIKVDDISYFYSISRDPATKYYNIQYIDLMTENVIISIDHKSFQALLDETIHAIKVLNK